QAFAKSRLSQNRGPIVVLQRAGDDLGGTRGLRVHQHRQWKRIWRSGLWYVHVLAFDASSFDAEQLLIRFQEVGGGREGSLYYSARVVAQIQHQALQLLAAKFFNRCLELLCRQRIEAADADITDAGLQ